MSSPQPQGEMGGRQSHGLRESHPCSSRPPTSFYPRVIAIVGPTASGKSALAEEVALRLGTSVVSADSMQVYRGMDIGTAKTPPEQRRAPLECVDLVDPGQEFSVAEYAPVAHRCIDLLVEHSGAAVVCGGTGLYIRAALEDMSFPAGAQTQNPVRDRYEQLAASIGAQALHERLAAVDPRSAELIHPNNVRRVIRAFELLEQGVSYADNHEGLHTICDRHPTLMVGLTLPRQELYRRIDARVDRMIADGLLDEVRSLVGKGVGDALTARQAIGYKELIDAGLGARGEGDVPQTGSGGKVGKAVELIKMRSRRYAKRQMTWFRKDPRTRWLDCSDLSVERAADTVLGWAREMRTDPFYREA